jgi:hypothetical protein
MFNDYKLEYPLPDTTYCINPKGDESIFTAVQEFDKIRISQFTSNTKEVRKFDMPLELVVDKGKALIACGYDQSIQKYNVYVTFIYAKLSPYSIGAYVTMENIPQ